jgi:hypothetical protein
VEAKAAAVVTGVVQQPVAGSVGQLVVWVLNAAGLQFVAGSLRQSVDSGPRTTLVTTGCTKIGRGLLLAPSPLAITNTVPLLLVGLQVVKSGIPPPVFLFHVPAHSLPVVGSTSAMVISGVPLARNVPYVYFATVSFVPLQSVATGLPTWPICAKFSEMPNIWGFRVIVVT